MSEAAKRSGERDRRLTDEAAVATAESGHRQLEVDRFAADRNRPEGAVFGPVANDVGGLTVGAAVVLGVLVEVQRDDAVRRGRSQALVLAKPERAIE